MPPQNRMPRRNEKSLRVINATAVRPAVPSSVTPTALSMMPGCSEIAIASSGTEDDRLRDDEAD